MKKTAAPVDEGPGADADLLKAAGLVGMLMYVPFNGCFTTVKSLTPVSQPGHDGDMRRGDRSSATRTSLMDAALAFVTEGGTKLTISEVCRRADVSRPTFYQYFASIDELLGQAATERLTMHQDAALALAPEESPGSFHASLSQFLDRLWADRALVDVLRGTVTQSSLSRDRMVAAIAARTLDRFGETPPGRDLQLRAQFTAAGIIELLSDWLASDEPEREKSTYIDALTSLPRAVMTAQPRG